MARRAFDVIDVVEILLHWHAGRPKSVIADSLRVDAKTVRKYVAPAEAAGITPGGQRLSRAEWAELVGGWFPELGDARARSATFPAPLGKSSLQVSTSFRVASEIITE
jgi:hypothetical protein